MPTITKGTYIWQNTPSMPTSDKIISIPFKCEDTVYTTLTMTNNQIKYSLSSLTTSAYNTLSGWANNAYKTIIITQDTELTQTEYDLLSGNLTKKTYTYTVNWFLDSNQVKSETITSDVALVESELSLGYSTIATDLCSLEKNGTVLTSYIYQSDIVNGAGDFYLDIVNNTIVIHNYSTNLYLIYGATLKRMANAIRQVNGASDSYTPTQMIVEITKFKAPSGTINITTTAKTDVSSYQYAQIQDNNLVASNIKAGVSILGINGSYTSDATATASDIKSGKTAYVRGSKVTGTIPTYSGTTNVTSNQTLETSGMYLPSNIVVNVPSTPTQEKTAYITSNTETIITPDTGKALSKVTITTDVPQMIEVATSAEMDAKLKEDNVSLYYKYTGTTDDKYTNGDIYQVQEG